MKTIDHVRLEYNDNETNSHKFYEVYLNEDNGSYGVSFSYGRIGRRATEGTKLQGGTLDQAEDCFEKLVESKMEKGYLDV